MSRRARVLHVITLAETGGAQTYVAHLLPALTERYDVTVAAWGPGPLIDAARAAGAEFVPLRHVRRSIGWRDALGLIELVRLFRRVEPDLVHLSSSKAGVLGRIAAVITRVPARVFTVHGWAFRANHGLVSALYLWADRLTRSFAHAIICVSQTEKLAGVAARTCGRDAIVIENAVDVSNAAMTKGDNIPPRILSIGRLKAPKDFVTLARALRRLEPGTFAATIVGDGPDRQRLKAELEGTALIAGERRDVRDLLADADIFVLATTSEGMPMTILEAMAAGLPVVATAVGGIPEIVEDGATGLLVPPRDPGALAEALRRLLTDPQLRRRCGARGRERALAHYDLPRFRAQHLQLYERLLTP